MLEGDVEAFETLSVVTKGESGVKTVALEAKSREALRKVVREMRVNLLTLKKEVEVFDRDKLAFIERVEGYQHSCSGDNTWVWDASAWGSACQYLKICLNDWSKESSGSDELSWERRLKRECEKCVHDMARYKVMCEKGSTRNDATWGAGFRRTFNLQCKLEALKNLA